MPFWNAHYVVPPEVAMNCCWSWMLLDVLDALFQIVHREADVPQEQKGVEIWTLSLYMRKPLS